MKKLFLKALLCCVCISFLFIGKAKAQYMVNGKEVDTTFNSAMNHIFGTLDASRIPFGLLRDYAMEFTNLENFDGAALVDSNKIDKGIFRQIYTALATARMTAAAYAALPKPGTIDSLWYQARQPGQVTLSGVFYQYSYLDPNAANNGKITITNGQLFDKFVSGVWQNPYLQGNVVGFAPAGDNYQGTAFNIMLPTNLWFTNSNSLVSSIQVDAGDGLGYRTITPGTSLPVSYADTGMKALNFKVFLTNSSVLQSHTQLHVAQDPFVLYGGGTREGAPFTSHGLTTTQYNNIYNATSTTTYYGISSYGIVTVQLAYGHTSLIKPLIVAEGFDAGIYTKPESPTGEHSYGDFITSINKSLSPSLISLIADPTSSQYDIVFIDFRNGTDDIHRNALVVEDVIRWVNANKTGNNKIMVLGQSMGGLCARCALKTMENNGETHNVSLFISHGTPEQGVVVPLGLQYFENHLSDFSMRLGTVSLLYTVVEFFGSSPYIPGILSLTETPAAKQMLINRIDNNFNLNNTVHNAWQTELTNLGYPTQGNIRNIAISNGSECGQAQTLQQNGQLLYLDGKLHTGIVGDILGMIGFPAIGALTFQPAFLAGVVPGRNDISMHFIANAANSPGGSQIYTGKITYKKTILWLIPVSINLTNRSYNAPSGTFPYETFGGDFYVPPINPTTLAGSITVTKYNIMLAKYSLTFSMAPSFCFVPTPSALDIGKGLVTLQQSDYSAPYTEISPPATNSPFANYITAFTPLGPNVVNNNEEHITYETRNGNWLVNELKAQLLPNLADCSTLCQNYTISGDANDCNSVKTYSVPSFSNVSYNWTTSGNLHINSGNGTPSVQIQPLSGTNGQQGTINVKMSIPNCDTQRVTRTIAIGVEPLAVTSIVDRTPQSSNYQYLTATAKQLPGTTPGNYTWYLTNSNGVVQYQIGNGLQLTNYPIAPCSTVYYQCQAVTPCGTAIYNGYAYNTNPCGYAMTNQSVIIYPNPSNNLMTVTNNSIPATMDASGNPNGNVPQSYRILVYNDKGQILKSTQNANGNTSINIGTADLANGNYFLHIIQGKNVIEKQIVVQH